MVHQISWEELLWTNWTYRSVREITVPFLKKGGLFCFLAFSHIFKPEEHAQHANKAKFALMRSKKKTKNKNFGKGLNPHSSRHKGGFSTGVRDAFPKKSTAELLITSSEVWGNSLCLRHFLSHCFLLLLPFFSSHWTKIGLCSIATKSFGFEGVGNYSLWSPSTTFSISHIDLAMLFLLSLFNKNARKTHLKLSHQWHSLPHGSIKAKYLIGLETQICIYLFVRTPASDTGRDWETAEDTKVPVAVEHQLLLC